MSRAPECSIGSGSGFKASQKTGPWVKISSDRLGEAGSRAYDPWFTKHRLIPYTTVAIETRNLDGCVVQNSVIIISTHIGIYVERGFLSSLAFLH